MLGRYSSTLETGQSQSFDTEIKFMGKQDYVCLS